MHSRSLATVVTATLMGSLRVTSALLPTCMPTGLAQDFRNHVRAAGLATVRLDQRRMERLRALMKEMTVPDRGSR